MRILPHASIVLPDRALPPIDHIIARQHGGETTVDNLALSCLHDNTHKGPNIAELDPQPRRITRHFNPRKDRWERHLS